MRSLTDVELGQVYGGGSYDHKDHKCDHRKKDPKRHDFHREDHRKDDHKYCKRNSHDLVDAVE